MRGRPISFHLHLASAALVLLLVFVPTAGAEPLLYPNDPLFSQQWCLHNTGQEGGTPGADIHALQAWGISHCSPDEVIAMLDTGIDATHPEFASKLVPGSIFVPGVTSTEDVFNHGTGTAGVATAVTDNGQGIAGVCPLGRIMPVKVANDQGRTDDPEVALGIRWAVDHGARVVNMSLTSYDIPPMRDAVAYAYAHNVVVVAASIGGQVYPADYPHVIAVGGTDRRDHSIGPVPHDSHDLVVAPMEGILTTTNDGGYANFCTCYSIAAPVVSGIAALLFSVRPDLTVDQVISVIEKGADAIDGQKGFNRLDGWGRVNAFHSLQLAQRLPSFVVKASVKVRALSAGARQTLSIHALPGTRLLMEFSYSFRSAETRAAQVGRSGIYRINWRPGRRAGNVSIKISGTHGWAVKTTIIAFTIR